MNVIKLFSRKLSTRPIPDFLKVSDEVAAALHENRAIVALESTIIAHGLPYPINLETGLELEQIIRSESAVPATVAIMNGKVCVGLTEAELSEIAESKNVAKISRRDMARCVANKALGATTVASTMWAAHQAGIRVFATGGIGGVHRYAEETFDISADLQELAATPVTVVCAGVKSILDIPKTLEYLETHSVNTIVYSTKNDFPAFFARESGSKGQFSTTDLAEAARIIETSKTLGLPAGTILACPIPEEFAAKGKVIEEAIKQALEEARAQNIMGQATTPFLLSRVKELTGGESLKSNVALVKNNAKIAAKLANHLVGRSKNSETSKSPAIAAPNREIQKPVRPKVVTIGAAICDFEAITSADVKNDGGSYPGIVTQRPGGVGRNHADVMARLGLDSALLTYVGNDENGSYLRRTGQHIDLSGVKTVDAPTATYCAINMRGNVRFGISSIEEIMGKMGPEIVHANMDLLEEADFLVIDGNTKVETLKEAIEVAYRINLPIWFEPTDIDKMQKLFKAGNIEKVSVTSPNLNEFRELCRFSGVATQESYFTSTFTMQKFIHKHHEKLPSFRLLVVTMGEKGVVVCHRTGNGYDILTRPSPLHNSEIVSVSGAGDCWNGGFLAGHLTGRDLDGAINLAQETTAKSLKSTFAVPIDIQPIL